MAETLFTPEMDVLLVKHYKTSTNAEMVELFGGKIKSSTIRLRATRKFKLKKNAKVVERARRVKRFWTQDKLDYLTAAFNRLTRKELAVYFGVTEGAIFQRARSLGLIKKTVKKVPKKSRNKKKPVVVSFVVDKTVKSKAKAILKAQAAKKKESKPDILPNRIIDTTGCQVIKIGNMTVTVKKGRDPEVVRERILNRPNAKL